MEHSSVSIPTTEIKPHYHQEQTNMCSSLSFDRDDDDDDKENIFFAETHQHGWTSFSSYPDMTDVRASVSFSMTYSTCDSSSTTNDIDALEDAGFGSGWSSMDQNTNHLVANDANDAGDTSGVWVTHVLTTSSSSPKSPAATVPSSTPSTRGALPPPRTCPTGYQEAYWNLFQTTTIEPNSPPALVDTRFLTNEEWIERRELRYRSLSTTTAAASTHRMPLASEQGLTPVTIHSENGVDQDLFLLGYSADSLLHDDDQWRRPIRRAQTARRRVELLQHRSSTVGRTCMYMIRLSCQIVRRSNSRMHRATTATTISREEGGGIPTPPPTTTTFAFDWPSELALRHDSDDDESTLYWSTGTRMCDDLSYCSSNNEGA